MKHLIKKLVGRIWRISTPIIRPVVHKFDQHITRLIVSVLPRSDTPANLDLALSSVVRELARLQVQVEILQQQIEDLESSVRDRASTQSRLSVVGEID
jgi:hypothetical protein